MNLSYRQWWMFDACLALGTVAIALSFDYPSLVLVAVGFVIVDRGRAYWQTGDWLSQPAAKSSGGADE